MENVYFHADIDSFFAAVEKLDNPLLANKAVIVGGNEFRGVVSTCSYEARKFGVRSGMPIYKAKQLCPSGYFLPVRMQRYQEKSYEVMSILKSYTPEFQQISIDEGFLNMSGTKRLLGEPFLVAQKLKREIFEKTHLTISIGIARTKYFAKLASDYKKPDGLYEIKQNEEISFIRSLPINKIWGIGKKSLEKLNSYGIINTEMLMNLDLPSLQKILGKAGGAFLANVLTGKTESIFNEKVQSHSISTERTFDFDVTSADVIEYFLFQLCSEIVARLVYEKVYSDTIAIKIRYSNFKTITRQESNHIVNDSVSLFNIAKKIFYKSYEDNAPIRLIGVAALNVTSKNNTTMDLFNLKTNTKKVALENEALKISKKYGKGGLVRARLLDESK